jgi:predicted metal-dependent phosphotriesterase family hydrolase
MGAPIPQLGQWFARVTSWGGVSAYGPVSKVTAQRVYYKQGWRETYEPLGIITHVGDEAEIKELQERIRASAKIAAEEKREADLRHHARSKTIAADYGHLTNEQSQ